MLAGNKVSGVPIDMQGGAGPARVPGQITHEFEEAASAGKFWIEKVGGGRHGRNDARSEVGRILGGEGKVVVAVISNAVASVADTDVEVKVVSAVGVVITAINFFSCTRID